MGCSAALNEDLKKCFPIVCRCTGVSKRFNPTKFFVGLLLDHLQSSEEFVTAASRAKLQGASYSFRNFPGGRTRSEAVFPFRRDRCCEVQRVGRERSGFRDQGMDLAKKVSLFFDPPDLLFALAIMSKDRTIAAMNHKPDAAVGLDNA